MTVERKLVTWKDLKGLGWPFGRTYTYQMIADGHFPKPFKLGRGRRPINVWYWYEVEPFFEPS